MTSEADAAALIQAMQENAKRLGLSWDLTMATVTDGDDPGNVSAVFDADQDSNAATAGLISMVGMLAPGARVYVMQIPPAGNYIVGAGGAPRGLIGGNYTINGGFVAVSAGAEVAVPTLSWNQEPVLTFRSGYLYSITAQFAPNTDGATAHWGFFKVRKGQQTITGTVLMNAYVQIPAGFAGQGASNTQVGWVKNLLAQDVQTKLSMTVQRQAGANNVRIYGGDATSPTYISVKEECPYNQADGLKFVAIQI